jgi:hypothetical protein
MSQEKSSHPDLSMSLKERSMNERFAITLAQSPDALPLEGSMPCGDESTAPVCQ